jgi:hypothetical protein
MVISVNGFSRSTTSADSNLLDRLSALLPEVRSNPEAKARFEYVRDMASAALARTNHRIGYYEHLRLQYERAALHLTASPIRSELLERLKRDLARGDREATEQTIDVNEFPWQQTGHRPFTESTDWRIRFGKWAAPLPRLVELGAGDEEFRPCVANDVPAVLFFSGNRQAYVGLEHEPASRYFGQELATLAEAYVLRAAKTARTILPLSANARTRIVAPVYGALDSRHEQRLIHFAVSQDPYFVHPSIRATATDLARFLFFVQRADGSWIPKSEAELAAAPRLRVVTHSYGSTAFVQCLTFIRTHAESAGIRRASLDSYFARSVCVHLGGYRLDPPAGPGPAYHCVTSVLDEIALGSPEANARYTSPVVLPQQVWQSFTLADLRAIVSGNFAQVAILRNDLGSNLVLWTPVLPGPTCYDRAGLRIAEFESSNGHHLAGYVEAATTRMPALCALLKQE